MNVLRILSFFQQSEIMAWETFSFRFRGYKGSFWSSDNNKSPLSENTIGAVDKIVIRVVNALSVYVINGDRQSPFYRQALHTVDQ